MANKLGNSSDDKYPVIRQEIASFIFCIDLVMALTFSGQLVINGNILCLEDMLCVVKPSLVLGRDGRPVQRTRRRFSIRDANKQIKS